MQDVSTIRLGLACESFLQYCCPPNGRFSSLSRYSSSTVVFFSYPRECFHWLSKAWYDVTTLLVLDYQTLSLFNGILEDVKRVDRAWTRHRQAFQMNGKKYSTLMFFQLDIVMQYEQQIFKQGGCVSRRPGFPNTYGEGERCHGVQYSFKLLILTFTPQRLLDMLAKWRFGHKKNHAIFKCYYRQYENYDGHELDFVGACIMHWYLEI